jgi:hypothetical protein
VSRVPEADILNLTSYDYWNGSAWVNNDPSAAKPIIPPVTSTSSSGGLFSSISTLFGGTGTGLLGDLFGAGGPLSFLGLSGVFESGGALSNVFADSGPLGFLGLSDLFGGGTQTGYVSEMSVQYNDYLKRYVVMYTDQSNNVVMRTSVRPEGPWSDPTTLVTSASYPGLYAPMMHPWSTGQDVYWNLSLWGDYNVKLMHTTLG